MPPSKIPSRTKKATGKEERCTPSVTIPWSPAECHQLTESVLALTPTRVRYPQLPFPTEKDLFRNSTAVSNGKAAGTNISTPLSNTGKRRSAITNLSRTEPHSSHSVRMAQIFQDAASEIRRSSKETSTPGSTPANIKRSRIPFLSARPPPPMRIRHTDQQSLVSPTRRLAAAGVSPARSEMIESFPMPPLPQITVPQAAASRPGREPISSGFSSPTRSPVRPNDAPQVVVATPKFEKSDDVGNVVPPSRLEEPKVPPSTPSRVDDWLNEVLDLSPTPIPPPLPSPTDRSLPIHTLKPLTSTHLTPALPNLKHRISLTSDKENIPPSTIALSWSSIASSSPRRRILPTALQLQSREARVHKTPVRSPQRKTSASSSSFSIRDLPRRRIARTPAQIFHASEEAPLGLLNIAPKRKKLKSATSKASSSDEGVPVEGSPGWKTMSDQGSLAGKENVAPFEVFSEAAVEFHERVTSLSPKVEVFRKGRGPRVERKRSYWDEDILGEGSARVEKGREDEGKGEDEGKRGVGKERFEFSAEYGFRKRVVLGELAEGQV